MITVMCAAFLFQVQTHVQSAPWWSNCSVSTVGQGVGWSIAHALTSVCVKCWFVRVLLGQIPSLSGACGGSVLDCGSLIF